MAMRIAPTAARVGESVTATIMEQRQPLESLVILIPVALIFTALAIAALIWAVRTGQYDDLDRAARDILFDDPPPAAGDRAAQQEQNQDTPP